MNLTISGHHLEVTPALRSYVTQKLDRVIRHFDQVVDVKVLLTVEKQKEKEKRQRAECNIHVKGNDMFAESAHEDLYAAVDDLVNKAVTALQFQDMAWQLITHTNTRLRACADQIAREAMGSEDPEGEAVVSDAPGEYVMVRYAD